MKNILQYFLTNRYFGAVFAFAFVLFASNINAQCNIMNYDDVDYVCPGSTTTYRVQGLTKLSTWKLFDLDGVELSSTTVFGVNSISFDWSGFTPDSGPYLLEVENGGYTDNIEIYVQKTNLNMACNDLVMVSLGSNCEHTLSADEVTEAMLYQEEDYNVTLFNTDFTPRTDPIGTFNDIGDTLVAMVTHKCSGLSCMGNVAFVDKLGVVLECGSDTIACGVSIVPDTVGDVGFPLSISTLDSIKKVEDQKYKVLISGDCGGEFTLSYEDDFIPYDCDSEYNYKIGRTWTAVDNYGNEWSCTDTIVVLKVKLKDVCSPTNFDGMSGRSFFQCNDSNSVSSVYWPYKDSIPSPEVTGYPVQIIYDKTGKPKDTIPLECSHIQYLYEDLVLSDCGYNKDIIRTWIILDWCTSNTKTCEQVLSFVDDTPPTFTLPPDTLVFNTNKYECFGDVYPLPEPTVLYECSDWTYKVLGYNFTGKGGCNFSVPCIKDNLYFKEGKWGIKNLPVDSIICVKYEVEDECGLKSLGNMRVVVRDNVKPYAVCDKHTVVTLLGSEGVLLAESLDDKSSDNCGIVDYEIRRGKDNCGDYSNTKWGESVTFCCNDLGKKIDVYLRVTDGSGNTDECRGYVEVEDAEKPVLTYCPPDFSVDCGDDYTNIFIGGKPKATDNCGIAKITHKDVAHINDCGIGYVTRIWKIIDKQGLETKNKCIQTITVESPNPLTYDDITWPPDITVNGCWPNVNINENVTGFPSLKESHQCTNIGFSYKDEVDFDTDDIENVCVVIHRKFFVGDWCDEDAPHITHTQDISVNDGGAPQFEDCGTDYVQSGENCSVLDTVTAYAKDDCTAQDDIYYTFKVYDEEGNLISSGVGNKVVKVFSRGLNKIVFTAEDDCGNQSTCTKYLRVQDSKPPTPLCLNKISTSLGDMGMVSVKAKDFDHGSTDNCTPSNMGECGCITELRFAYSTDLADSLVVYTCDSLTNGIGQSFNLQVYVFDLDGNKDFCNVVVEVIDGKDVCPDRLDIGVAVSGTVFDENLNGVEGFKVNGMTINDQSIEGEAESNTAGEYVLSGLKPYEKYQIVPKKNSDPLDGLTTLDLVYIQKHILGINKFDSPYKLIAADVNNSSSITASDILILRKLILGVIEELPNGKSWKFVKAYTEFDNPSQPWYFDDRYTTDELYLNVDSMDFIAVKLGDVNGSANVFNGIEARSGYTKYFETNNSEFGANQSVQVDFSISESDALVLVSGFQFTIEYDYNTLEFVGVDNRGKLNMSSANVNELKRQKGKINVSWNNSSELQFNKEDLLFRLKFRSKDKGELKDVFAINSSVVKSEIYDENLEVSDLELKFRGVNSDSNEFALHQNIPNPFSNSTKIVFDLPQDSDVSIRIFDNTGKTISTAQGHYSKGQNSITVKNEDLGKSGIYFYEVTTDKNSITKRMVFLK